MVISAIVVGAKAREIERERDLNGECFFCYLFILFSLLLSFCYVLRNKKVGPILSENYLQMRLLLMFECWPGKANPIHAWRHK